MKRSIGTLKSVVKIIENIETKEKLSDWLTKQGKKHHLHWLLAHVDDTVIWGEMRDGNLHVKEPHLLRWMTLLQCRLFGDTSELFLFKGPRGWRARLRCDESGETLEYLDEEHLLWGTKGKPLTNGFMRVWEGSQGIVQTLPIQTKPDEILRARLRVRHYLEEDESGVIRIAHSRLVSLIEPKGGCS